MPLVTMRQLLDEAAKGGYGVGAFNVNDMEQIQAIMIAARQTKSPVIAQASRGARAFAEDLYLFKLIQAAVELNPEIPIAMHQDHGNSFETCKSAIALGYRPRGDSLRMAAHSIAFRGGPLASRVVLRARFELLRRATLGGRPPARCTPSGSGSDCGAPIICRA